MTDEPRAYDLLIAELEEARGGKMRFGLIEETIAAIRDLQDTNDLFVQLANQRAERLQELHDRITERGWE